MYIFSLNFAFEFGVLSLNGSSYVGSIGRDSSFGRGPSSIQSSIISFVRTRVWRETLLSSKGFLVLMTDSQNGYILYSHGGKEFFLLRIVVNYFQCRTQELSVILYISDCYISFTSVIQFTSHYPMCGSTNKLSGSTIIRYFPYWVPSRFLFGCFFWNLKTIWYFFRVILACFYWKAHNCYLSPEGQKTTSEIIGALGLFGRFSF